MMMWLLWLYCVFVYMIYKFGYMFSGMVIWIVDVFRIMCKVGVEEFYGSWCVVFLYFFGLVGVCLFLVSELVVFVIVGDFWFWVL